jgi:hypothetical protein
MHDAHDVLKSGMLGSWKDPPGRLELVDLPHSLYPGMIDDLPFRRFLACAVGGRGEWNVSVDWVEAQAFSAWIVHGGPSVVVPPD